MRAELPDATIRRVASLRHADVHEHHVGLEALDQRDRRAPVGRLSHHLDVLTGVENHAKAAANERLVVGDRHAHAHRAGSRGRRACTR
jgi:hypothetical protein